MPSSSRKSRHRSTRRASRCSQWRMVEFPSWPLELLALARFFSWVPMVPGDGEKGSKISTIIASGDKSFAGWLINGIWPKENRCDSITLQNNLKFAKRSRSNANVMEKSGEPLSQGDVTARIVSPSGKAETIRCRAEEGSGARFRVNSARKNRDSIKSHCDAFQTDASLEAKLFVQGAALERIGKPARPEVLEELARVSKGRFSKLDKMENVVEAISRLQDPPPEIRRVQLWSHPLVAATLIGLLGLFWGTKADRFDLKRISLGLRTITVIRDL